jgi:hypothetical protein
MANTFMFSRTVFEYMEIGEFNVLFHCYYIGLELRTVVSVR